MLQIITWTIITLKLLLYLIHTFDTFNSKSSTHARYLRFNIRSKVRLWVFCFISVCLDYLPFHFPVFAHCGVQHILCYFFVLVVFVLCFVYPMLPVSLDCPFSIAPSVFSNVYLN